MTELTPELARKILKYRAKYEKYRYYTPNGKVEEFIQLVGNNKTFISLFSAANGVGKTAAGANILAHLMFPLKNDKWFNYSLFKDFPYPKAGRIVSDPTTVQSTVIRTLKEWFPAHRYTTDKKGKNYEYHWKTDTGYEFDVMTYDQQVKEFESATLGWAWFDEPPPEAIYKATVSRMRKGGVIFITMTPLTGSAYLYDQIITNPLQGQREFITADIEANCIEHGVRGILKHTDIEKMIAEYNEEDKQARIKGQFQHLVGLVFKKFTRNIHVIKPFHVNLRDFCVYQRADTHPRNPDAVGWYAVDRMGRKYIIDELYGEYTTEEFCYRVKQKDDQYRVINRKIDPSAFIVDQHTNNSLAQRILTISNYFLRYEPASKERTMAIQRTKDAIDYEIIMDQLVKPPELYVFDTCIRHIYEFEHWQYNEYTGKLAERKDRSERPQDKDDHMMENTGRFLIDEPGFIEMPLNFRQSTVQGSVPVSDPY